MTRNQTRRDILHPAWTHTLIRYQDPPRQPETAGIAPTPLAIFDASYSTGYNKNEEEYNRADTGFRYGRLELTGRLGGFFRPLLAQEVKSTLVTLEQKLRENGRPVPVDLEASLKLRQEDFSFQSSKSILPMSLVPLGTPTPALPGRLVADRLMLAFAHNVNYIARIVHMPTLYNIYEIFWRQTNDGFSPSRPSAALVHASIFAGLVSLDSSGVLRDLGTAKDILMRKSNLELSTHFTMPITCKLRNLRFSRH